MKNGFGIFTGRVSHKAMKTARSVATAGGVRVAMCLDRIIKEDNKHVA